MSNLDSRPPRPVPPEDFDALVRAGVRRRYLDTLYGVGAGPVLILGLMGAGSFMDGALVWGVGLVSTALAMLGLTWLVLHRRYGPSGHRWVQRIEDLTSRREGWQRIDVWFITPDHWKPHAERQVLVAEPGGAPFVMAAAPRGTAASCTPGPGWVWGTPTRGKPLVVHVDGRTLWCVGPAYGRLGVALMRLAALVSPIFPLVWLDRPGDIRSSLKPW